MTFITTDIIKTLPRWISPPRQRRVPPRRRVMFLHRPAHNAIGSKVMRCDQLAQIATREFGHRYDFEVVKLHMPGQARRQRELIERTRGAIVILLKGAEHSFDDDGLSALREAVRGLCIDHVDSTMHGRAVSLADVQIAASNAGFQTLQRLIRGTGTNGHYSGVARLLTHHADPRIVKRSDLTDNRVKLGYFGALHNTIIPPDLTDAIHAPPMRGGTGFADILGAVRRSNMHYAVRPRPQAGRCAGHKPFTKGFNAASANANIIINRDADDALDYLGPDYPFLIKDASPASIIEGVRYAEDAFGSAEWRYGLEIMDHVRRQCALDRIMEQLASILELFD
ncbi:MAG: hypothetical protein AAF367_03805 [Pseudomonadota bacterium]